MQIFEYPYVIITILVMFFIVMGLIGLHFTIKSVKTAKGAHQKDFCSMGKIENDFESAIYLTLEDTIMEKKQEYIFNCPFIRRGDDLEILYEYTPRGLVLEITYKELEEQQELKIKY
jgi:hypothetical protein